MFTTRTLATLIVAAAATAVSAQSPAKPDLVIQDITFNANGNEVKLKTQNIGNAKAENFRVRLRVVASVAGQNGGTKGLFDQAKTFNRINAGDTETKDFEVNFASVTAQADAFKAELLAKVDLLPGVRAAQKLRLKKQINDNFKVEAVAAADSDNQVNEVNENNNNRTETFPVQ